MIEIRTVKITWHVETGYCDGGGIGLWDETVESIPFDTEEDAKALLDKWVSSGKLERTHWGELRPKFGYGLFRIRRSEEVLDVSV
jgi:hypothetical protein